MFDLFKSESEKDTLIECYEKLLELKDGEIAELSKKVSTTDADFEIDWDQLNPFSIERLIDNRTSLGYFSSGETREWFLHCSFETHQRLAAEFREFLFNKYNEE
jgi:hypothetical protein